MKLERINRDILVCSIKPGDQGLPVKTALQKHFPYIPKYDISFALERGYVSLNGQPLWNEDIHVRTGQQLELRPFPFPRPEDVAKLILFEDEYFVVINKPFNLSSQPTADRKRINMVDLLRDYWWLRDHKVVEPGVVHRLDKDTSGVIVYLKDHDLHRAFDKMFQNHQISKTYIARVSKQPTPTQGCWEHTLSEFPDPQTKRIVLKEPNAPHTGLPDKPAIGRFRKAITGYRVLGNRISNLGTRSSALIELTPQTGRMHQLRIQCAEAGCPILGDVLYAPEHLKHYPLMFLHASALRFQHPVTKAVLHITVDPAWDNFPV